jgi:hypothetical protein
MSIPIEDRVGLSPARRRALDTAVAAQRTLEDVIRWLLPVEVVVQDEFTHDVVVAWDDVWLVYDTT